MASREFLQNFLTERSDARVLEFGAGGSSIWMARFTNNLVTIEHDPGWAEVVSVVTQGRVDLRLVPEPYHGVCAEFPDEFFDLILVDGRNRLDCVKASLRILRPGGVLMIDNAEKAHSAEVYSLLADWPMTRTRQELPDETGFWYEGWETNWWVKPPR